MGGAAGQGTGVDATVEDQQRAGGLLDGTLAARRCHQSGGVPAGFIAGTDFNTSNRPLHVAGVREMNCPLFRMLEETADEAEAGEAFGAYMATMFGLRPEAAGVRRKRRDRGGAITPAICGCCAAGPTTAIPRRGRC